ncbi:DNA glycosylase AlkZ-like family protein [Cellulomonas xiejunii]|uniref:Winged helix DNA-binding domain-containing protein n=1 Tax=Cellulomonas xiejunii TaxID=2968083 RepID=A0ABY5KQG6_9CELL|nr:crosslink repair DNA glycosylase YcaQ family protein [Cellulomonas xiejunii]MCC2321375.1 winged helix DNA-binding domain-containing protein [Cellulomonas xiejunii]UUI71958.1 winged helix DNA-binding domain-containing protein [Cellulomonas xiejunii]
MTRPHHLTRADARRVAVRAQLLAAGRPTGVLDVVRHLTVLQPDPTSAVAPSADVVLWSRIGSDYDPLELRDLVDQQRLVEIRGFLRPAEDVALFRAEMDEWPGRGEVPQWREGVRQWAEANEAARQDVLELLRADGPLPASRIPDTCAQPWRSTGWNDRRSVQMLLGVMAARGEVAVSGTERREKLWDLASRVYPDTPAVPSAQARRIRDERRLRALGIARPRASERPGEPDDVGQAGEPAIVEGVRGTWRVDPTALDQPLDARAALLSPLDRLVLDRKRMTELFESDYQLEMYKPAAKRRWGYWAMPVLHGDRLVGKLDATADVRAGVLRVTALHRDVPFTATMTADVDREIDDLARWLELDLLIAS